MPENLTSINIGLLGQLKSVRVCLIHPILKNLQRGHPCKHLFYVYFSRLHRNIPTIYFAGVFVMMSTVMHFWYCLELQSSDKKNLYINVLFCTPEKTFSSKNGKIKNKKKTAKIIKLERYVI